MTRQRKIWTVLLILTCLAWASQAAAEAPAAEQLADRCIEAMKSIADDTVERNREAAEKCVATIERLLAAGEFEKAEMAAGHRIRRVRYVSKKSVHQIVGRSKPCLRKLTELELPGLVEKVRTARAAQVDRVRQSCERAVGAIENALPPAP